MAGIVGPVTIGVSMGTHQISGCLLQPLNAYVYYDSDHILLPCYVAFTENGVLLGRAAYNQMEDNPDNTIYDIKRLMGRFYDDPDIQDYLLEWPFKVVNIDNKPKYKVMFKGVPTLFFPEEIMALLFQRIKEHAEFHLQLPVNDAVVTVASQFNSLQRQATINAAMIAGFNVLSIMNETTAAAFVYGYFTLVSGQADKNLAVVSVGSGFVDVSLVTYGDMVFEVKATRGACTLDVNRAIVHFFAHRLQERYGLNVFEDKRAYIRLKKACGKAKYKLKHRREVTISIPSIAPGLDFEDELSRNDLDEILDDLRLTIVRLAEQCLLDVGWEPILVDICLLVGGSSELNSVMEAFYDIGSSMKDCHILQYPQMYGLLGAAFRAASMQRCSPIVRIMSLEDLVILEVSPNTIGVRTAEGKCRPFIRQNDSIPHWATREYTTTADYQAAFRIKVFIGESLIASQNKFLAEYLITDFTLRRRGKTQIRVTFQVTSSGTLVVMAEDRSPNCAPGRCLVHNESGPMLKEELTPIMFDFHQEFPPAPIPVPPPPQIPNGQNGDSHAQPEVADQAAPPVIEAHIEGEAIAVEDAHGQQAINGVLVMNGPHHGHANGVSGCARLFLHGILSLSQ